MKFLLGVFILLTTVVDLGTASFHGHTHENTFEETHLEKSVVVSSEDENCEHEEHTECCHFGHTHHVLKAESLELLSQDILTLENSLFRERSRGKPSQYYQNIHRPPIS